MLYHSTYCMLTLITFRCSLCVYASVLCVWRLPPSLWKPAPVRLTCRLSSAQICLCSLKSFVVNILQCCSSSVLSLSFFSLSAAECEGEGQKKNGTANFKKGTNYLYSTTHTQLHFCTVHCVDKSCQHVKTLNSFSLSAPHNTRRGHSLVCGGVSEPVWWVGVCVCVF